MTYLRNMAVFMLGTALLPACKNKTETIQPTVGQITESVYASGIVKSKNQYQVFSTVNGLIEKILVKEGDMVKKGDPLMVIQNETSRLNAENARISADFAAVNTKGDRLNELKSAIDLAKSKMLNDSVLFDRQKGLWAQQIGSKVELEQRELAFIASRNNYQSTVYRYNDLKKQLNFAASQSQKLLSISDQIARDYVIRSQTDGMVYSIAKAVGEMVNIQSPVAVIGDSRDFIVELQIDENDIVHIQKGQRVFLSLDSYKGQVFEAAVSLVNPMMNERTRTFTAEAIFVQQPPALYPNLTSEANVVIRVKNNALTIPRSCLLNDSTVMLANKEKRIVKTGLKDYLKVEILSGIQPGESLIIPQK